MAQNTQNTEIAKYCVWRVLPADAGRVLRARAVALSVNFDQPVESAASDFERTSMVGTPKFESGTVSGMMPIF